MALLNNEIKSKTLVKTIFRHCEITHDFQCYFVYEGRFFRCTPAAFSPKRLELLGKSINAGIPEGVLIHQNSNLVSDLKTYMSSTEYLASCRYCLGTVGKRRPSEQLMSKEALRLELHEDHAKIGHLIDKMKLLKLMVRRKVRPITAPYMILKNLE